MEVRKFILSIFYPGCIHFFYKRKGKITLADPHSTCNKVLHKKPYEVKKYKSKISLPEAGKIKNLTSIFEFIT